MRIHFLLTVALCGCAVDDTTATTTTQAVTRTPVFTRQVSGTIARLQSIAPVSEEIVWVSGAAGTILRTTDGGANWISVAIPGTSTLAFRDIHAVDANTAFVLTNNNSPNARIYKTVDGGANWTLEHQSPLSLVFYDCFAFWSPTRAIAVPDAELGGFDVIRMTDGTSWKNIRDKFGPAKTGEGLFPTSGNCVTTFGPQTAYAVIAGASPSRVVITRDGGDSFTSYDIPIPGGPSGGGMNVLFRDPLHGIISGGDVATPTVSQENFARSSDGGKTWTLATRTPFPGAAYALTYVPRHAHDHGDRDCWHHNDLEIFAAGPSGAAWSSDEGDSWELLPAAGGGHFGVEFASPRRGWIVGRDGVIQRIDM